MAIPIKFHTFQDGQVPAGKITAERLNKNWDELYKMFNPVIVGISEDNIASSSKILVSDRNYIGSNKITGNWEFNTFPVVPDASIPESKINITNIITTSTLDSNLPSNVVRSDSDEVISGAWTFQNPIENLVIESVDNLPETITEGRLVRYNGVLYIGKSGAWKKLYTADEIVGVGVVVGSTARISYTNTQSTSDTSYIKLKEITLNEAVKGTIKLGVTTKVGLAGHTGYLYFAVNDTMIDASPRTITNYVAYDEELASYNIDVSAGSKIQVWGKVGSTSYGLYCFVLKVYYDKAIMSFGDVSIASPLPLTDHTISWTGNL